MTCRLSPESVWDAGEQILPGILEINGRMLVLLFPAQRDEGVEIFLFVLDQRLDLCLVNLCDPLLPSILPDFYSPVSFDFSDFSLIHL